VRARLWGGWVGVGEVFCGGGFFWGGGGGLVGVPNSETLREKQGKASGPSFLKRLIPMISDITTTYGRMKEGFVITWGNRIASYLAQGARLPLEWKGATGGGGCVGWGGGGEGGKELRRGGSSYPELFFHTTARRA